MDGLKCAEIVPTIMGLWGKSQRRRVRVGGIQFEGDLVRGNQRGLAAKPPQVGRDSGTMYFPTFNLKPRDSGFARASRAVM